MTRIVVLSDIHLSPTHGFFWENWCVARDFANTANADAVVVNGDLTINGPESGAEIAFATSALNHLQGRVLPLPGNHDVETMSHPVKTRTRSSMNLGSLDGTIRSVPIAGPWMREAGASSELTRSFSAPAWRVNTHRTTGSTLS